MKKLFILTALMACAVFVSQAQHSWIERLQENPGKVLEDSKEMFREASREGNIPEKVLSRVLQANSRLALNESSLADILRELEGYISNNKNTVENALLRIFTAELYKDYYVRNRYVIDRRTPLSGDAPEQMEEWSKNYFMEKITGHCLEAIAEREVLQQTKARDFHILMLPQYPEEEMPALYDFLVYQGIHILNSVYPRYMYAVTDGGEENLLLPTDRFLSLSIDPAGSPEKSIRFLYQQILSFRSETNHVQANIMAELSRLSFEYELKKTPGLPGSDSLYLLRLEELKSRYANQMFSNDIRYQEAQFHMNYNTYHTTEHDHDLFDQKFQKAYRLTQEGLELYPDYPRRSYLSRIDEQFNRDAFRLSFDKQINPGILSVTLDYYNLNGFEITLTKINSSTTEYTTDKESVARETVYHNWLGTPGGKSRKDTTLHIPVNKGGLYEVRIMSSNSLPISNMLFCTPYHTTYQLRDSVLEFLVRDISSGKAMPDVDLNLYHSTYHAGKNQYQKVLGLKTDRNGLATVPLNTLNSYKNTFNLRYETISETYPNSELKSVYLYSHPQKTDAEFVQLYTDRSLYRPGQTVYFKGISYADKKQPEVNEGKELTVTLYNTNRLAVASRKVKTNAWGSFSDHFILPAEVLNGHFSIETENGRASFRVEEYKLPGFEILPDTLKTSYRFGERIVLEGQVKSFSGVGLPDTRISVKINLQAYSRWSPINENIFTGEVQTDRDGRYNIPFTATPPEQFNNYYGFFYQVQLEATDNKGESQSHTQLIPMGKAAFNIQIQTPLFIEKKTQTSLYFKAISYNGQELSENLQYSICRLAPLDSLGQAYRTDSTKVIETMLTGTMNSLRDSLRPDFRKWKSGAYLIEVKGNATEEIAITGKQIFYLYSITDKKPPVLSYNWFVPVRTTFSENEAAEVIFGSSASKVNFMVELFKGNHLLKRTHFNLSDQITRYPIPYQASYGDGIEMVVSFVKDNQYYTQRYRIEKKAEDQSLLIGIKTFRDKITPGKEEKWEFTVSDQKRKPVDAEIMATMYDRSLDKISPYPFRWEGHFSRKGEGYLRGWVDNPTLRGSISMNYPPSFYFQPLYRFGNLNLYGLGNIGRSRVLFTGSATAVLRESDAKLANDDLVLSENTVVTGLFMRESSLSDQVIALRKNFRETAFFYPWLYPDADGNFSFSFTVPDAVTGWKLMLLAHTKELKSGTLRKEVSSVKELMVKPNLPRFFRSGDRTVIRATISNLSTQVQQGEALLELFDPLTKEVILKRHSGFKIAMGESGSVEFEFDVPEGISLTGCRISASTPTLSDGEQHLITIAPAEVLITESLPIYSTRKGSSTHTIKPVNNKRKDYRLTLEMTANPVWYAIMALPSLQEEYDSEDAIRLAAAFYGNAMATMITRQHPEIGRAIEVWKKSSENGESLQSFLERDKELKSIATTLTPWIKDAEKETERMQALERVFDLDRITYTQQHITGKLLSLQHADGSWSWYKGMPGNLFITCNVVSCLFDEAISGNNPMLKTMVANAVIFMDNLIYERYKAHKKSNTSITLDYDILLYLYTRTFCKEQPLLTGNEAHTEYVDLVKREWKKQSPYEKALSAVILKGNGHPSDALQVIHSLRGFATRSEDKGMYWANNRSSVTYMNSAILTHTAIMEAFLHVDRKENEVEQMCWWLLRQKQTQNWGAVPSTLKAIRMIWESGFGKQENQEKITVSLGNTTVSPTHTDPVTGYFKECFNAADIKPDMLHARVDKTQDSPTWGALYLQYFTPLKGLNKGDHEMIRIEKKLFIEQTTSSGKQLIPLDRAVHMGEKIIVRLTIKSGQDLQYVHLQDLRAACFEPVNQLSGTHWRERLVYYQENKDAGTNYFFHYLPQGTYVLEYPVWVNQSGSYQDGPATIQCLYAPEYISHSSAGDIQAE